jgi:hypothetical protein
LASALSSAGDKAYQRLSAERSARYQTCQQQSEQVEALEKADKKTAGQEKLQNDFLAIAGG